MSELSDYHAIVSDNDQLRAEWKAFVSQYDKDEFCDLANLLCDETQRLTSLFESIEDDDPDYDDIQIELVKTFGAMHALNVTWEELWGDNIKKRDTLAKEIQDGNQKENDQEEE